MFGLLLLQAAWVVGTPGFGGPDELISLFASAQHRKRTAHRPQGALFGPIAQLRSVGVRQSRHDRGARPRLPRAVRRQLRNGTTQPQRQCLEADPNGNFPPLPYLLPAEALSDANDATSALWWMRTASVLPALAFLILAVASLWDGTGWSVLGLLASLSPMVLFVSSIVNSSGLQITACLAFAAAALRIARAPARVPPWVWPVFALSGAVAIAGPIGLEFALFDLAVFGLVLGPRGLREVRTRTSPWTLALSALTLVAAGVLALIYTRVAGFRPRSASRPSFPA